MKCYCNDNGISKNNGHEMIKSGNSYYLKGNKYQKYECQDCKRTRVKVLDGYFKSERKINIK
jgi:transposase-like protein